MLPIRWAIPDHPSMAFGDWDESKHPRNDKGEFAGDGSERTAMPSKPPGLGRADLKPGSLAQAKAQRDAKMRRARERRDERKGVVRGLSHEMPREFPNAKHGDVVAKSKFGRISAVVGKDVRYIGHRNSGEAVGTFRTTHGAADALRAPKNADMFPSGHRLQDVSWEWTK